MKARNMVSHKSSLTALEWQVVELARGDGPVSAEPDGRLARFLRAFFGLRIARRLANDRFEALRRFCVRAWYWDRIRYDDVRPLLAAGYSTADVGRILSHVARARGFAPAMREQIF